MPFEGLTAGNREAAFALALRGRRLVFEVGLDENWFESAARTFKNPTDGEWCFRAQDLRRYPATLSVLLAAAGMLHYRGGNLWSHLGLSGPRAGFVGHAFTTALRQLGLETFDALVEDERALRYLTPILAHGGVPRYCLSDFFQLLVRTVRYGSTDPHEILSLWATRRGLTQGVDKPAIRFILHGGAPAADFLQRVVDLVLETRRNGRVPDPTDVGLPRSLVEAFAAFESEVRNTVSRDILPRPYVQLDPWDGLGPTLELPPAEPGVGSFDWRVRDERHTANYRGSHAIPQTVRLNPARHWEVESQARDKEPRTFVFDCFDPFPVLFFDPSSGRLWRGRDQLRLDSVWTLHDRETTLRGIDKSGNEVNPISIEGLPQPSGVWSTCQLGHYRLTDLKYLVVRRSDNPDVRFPVAPPAQRPTLSTGVDPTWVRSLGGGTLYPSLPTLILPEVPDVPWERWRITARCNDTTRNITADKLPHVEHGFSLEPLLHDWMLADIHFAVRGPLGSDLSALFAVVPGLVLERPREVLLPQEHDQIRVFCDTAVLGPNAAERVATFYVGPHVDQIRCQARTGSTELTFVVSVPRLRWTVSSSGDAGVSPASDLLVIDLSEVSDSRVATLVIAAGIPDIRMRLRLVAGPTTLQTSDWITTSKTGRLFFDLRRFRDTIIHSEHSNLEFFVDVENRTVGVVRLITRLEVDGIAAAHALLGDNIVTNYRFTDNQGRKGREVRFWSIDRPWEDAIVALVPDRVGAVVSERAEVSPVPGRYLVEVAIVDPWNRPVRPSVRSPNTALVTLGSPQEIEARRATLDMAQPLVAIECAISTGRASRPLSSKERVQVAVQCVAAACWQLNYLGAKSLHARSFHYVTDCLGGTSKSLVWGASRAIEESQVTAADLLRLALAVIPLLRVRSTEDDVSGALDVTDSMLRNVWSMCPPIAACHDVPAAVAGELESIERCEEFLGIRLGFPIASGAPIGLQEWCLSTDLLRQVRHAMELKPVRLLELDALAEANFEWLLAEREGRINSKSWCVQHSAPLDELPSLSAHSLRHLAARSPRQIVEDGMTLSRCVLMASMHIAAGSTYIEQAVQALLPLVDTLPRMLARDLTLAIVLVATAEPNSGSSLSDSNA